MLTIDSPLILTYVSTYWCITMDQDVKYKCHDQSLSGACDHCYRHKIRCLPSQTEGFATGMDQLLILLHFHWWARSFNSLWILDVLKMGARCAFMRAKYQRWWLSDEILSCSSWPERWITPDTNVMLIIRRVARDEIDAVSSDDTAIDEQTDG